MGHNVRETLKDTGRLQNNSVGHLKAIE